MRNYIVGGLKIRWARYVEWRMLIDSHKRRRMGRIQHFPRLLRKHLRNPSRHAWFKKSLHTKVSNPILFCKCQEGDTSHTDKSSQENKNAPVPVSVCPVCYNNGENLQKKIRGRLTLRSGTDSKKIWRCTLYDRKGWIRCEGKRPQHANLREVVLGFGSNPSP